MNSIFVDQELQQEVDVKGFVKTALLNPDELDSIREFYDALHPGGAVPQLRDGIHMTIWCSDPHYKTHVRETLLRMLQPAVERLFKPSRIIAPVFIVKMPGHHTTFPIHQDWSVVDETRHTALNMWVPLDDVGVENGGLWAVPGSHRLGNHIRGPGFLFPNLRPIEAAVADRIVPIGNRAGEAAIFYHRLIHGSPPNLSNRPRVALACSILPQAVPLHIYFQRDSDSPLHIFHPPDDFIYAFDNVRDQTAVVPPAGTAVALLPPHRPTPLNEGCVSDSLGMRDHCAATGRMDASGIGGRQAAV